MFFVDFVFFVHSATSAEYRGYRQGSWDQGDPLAAGAL